MFRVFLDYNGNDSFLYVANDGLLDSNGVTVAITVSPVVDILVVTKTGDTDDGVCNEDCSLREAIGAATPGDLVDIPAGTYTLDLGSELSVEQDLTLSGAGLGDTIIQGADVLGTAGTRVLAIQNGVNANISGVTIRHGDTTGLNSGAGISNAGNLTVIDSAVTHNLAESLGGGIHNSGVAELTGTTVSGNKSGSAGGGIHNNFGGILSLNNTRVINNGAVGDGGGINNYATLTAVNSSISMNESASRGGGIFVNGPTTMTGSMVNKNVAASGGGIYAWTHCYPGRHYAQPQQGLHRRRLLQR